MLAGLLHESPWGRAFETHFIAKYYRKLARYGDLSQRENCTRLARAIMSERPAQSWKLNVDYDKFCESLIRRDYPHIVDGLCCAHTARKGHISWGDKTPHYLLQLDIIQRLFPESKIVYIVRDGRDTALSLMRTAWGPANVYAAAAYWKLCNASGPVIDQLARAMAASAIRRSLGSSEGKPGPNLGLSAGGLACRKIESNYHRHQALESFEMEKRDDTSSDPDV